MSNVYLEKIALSKEEATLARKSGEKAFSKTELKGTALGTGVGAAVGATAIYNSAKKKGIAAQISKSVRGATPRKIRAATAVIGAVPGMVLGGALSQPFAAHSRNKEHTRVLNQYLDKEAAVTQKDVASRNDRNDTIKGLIGASTAAGGAAAGTAVVGAHAFHKGMKQEGGYQAVVDKYRNEKIRKSQTKSLGGNAQLVGKENQLVRSVNGRDLGNKVGARVQSALRRRGVLGASIGAAALTIPAMRKTDSKLDEADAKHYSKISK